jgi:hypothetical protein
MKQNITRLPDGREYKNEALLLYKQIVDMERKLESMNQRLEIVVSKITDDKIFAEYVSLTEMVK